MIWGKIIYYAFKTYKKIMLNLTAISPLIITKKSTLFTINNFFGHNKKQFDTI